MKIKTRKAAVVSRFHPSIAEGLTQEMKEKIVLNDIMAMAEGDRTRFDSLRRDPTLRLEMKSAVTSAYDHFHQSDSQELSEEGAGEVVVDAASESVVSEDDPTVIIQGND